MLDRIKNIRRFAIAGALVGILVPFTVDSSESRIEVERQDACAGALCCTELFSVCDGQVGYRNLCGSRG